ncbi:tachykinin-like peptides receptor 99D [Clytia hemisphaerica]|uniref:tachykinin-like peptides receptor 99D n=1 Tax=Clytia hemisphaerica TaxID=252671 RepID=UPI0034D48AD1
MMSNIRELCWDILSPTLGTLAFIINLLEIFFIIKLNKKLNIPLIYILSLAISDTFIGFIEILIKMLYFININYPSTQSNLYLEVFNFLTYVVLRISLIISALNLVAITIDRLYCVVRPVQYRKNSKKKAILICIGIWLVSIVFLTAFHYGLKNHADPLTTWRLQFILYPIVILPAAFLMSGVYFFIWYYFRKSNKRMTRLQEETSTIQNLRKRKEKRLLVLSVTVVAAFMICWLPMAFYWVLFMYSVKMSDGVNIVFTIAISNSVINPLIYFHFIRKSVWKWFKGLFERFQRRKQRTLSIRRMDTSTTTLATSAEVISRF